MRTALAPRAGKLRRSLTVAGITVLCLVDMWSVNKRYLHDEQFVPRSIQTETFSKTKTDELILQDKSPDYRVLNFATDASTRTTLPTGIRI